MDRGAWWATVHGIAKSRTQLSMQILSFECVSGGGREKHPGRSLSLSRKLFPKDVTLAASGWMRIRGCCSPSHHSYPASSPRLWFPLGSRTCSQALRIDSCLLCWFPVSPAPVLPLVSWPMPLEMISLLKHSGIS